MAVCIVVCMIVGYLFGCIQTGYIVGRVNKIDIRDYGSGNSGTTNTLRTLGKTAAIITFLGDAVKGLVAVNLARYVIMPAFHVEGEAYLWLLTGFAVVLGHNFPFYLGFKGGKGIAVSFGSLLGLIPMWYPVLSLAVCFLFFSLVIQISPNFYRTVAVYIVNWLIIVFSETNLPKAVHIGVGLISLLILLKMHMSQEEREKMTFQLLWIKR